MSAEVTTFIRCDETGCTMSYLVPLGMNLAEARAESDWLTIRSRGVKDYCLKHRRKHEVKKR